MVDVNQISIETVKEDDFYGEFVFDLLPPGYGYTIGTPLRRSLLTYMPGSAITSVKIAGVKHEFTTITGVKEDVLRILLNLKNVVVKNHTDKPQTLILKVKGVGHVTAGDIEKNSYVDIINKDFVIADLTAKTATLEMELTVENGVGYVMADNMQRAKIGNIPLDANFSTVNRVAMEVLPTRSGQETNLDKLVLKIWTKGNVKPSEALQNAIKHLRNIFGGMTDNEGVEEAVVVKKTKAKVAKAKIKATTTKKKK
jgi:DNA-directed RNA polymerase subunit alpha